MDIDLPISRWNMYRNNMNKQIEYLTITYITMQILSKQIKYIDRP